jgi:ABC-2 type transport system ATP-binding protein
MNANPNTPALEARQLSKGFGRTQALAPLDLIVPRGAVFALVGHNGAGKTTLIKLLMNILHPSSGGATVLGQPSTTLTGEAFTRIGYVSENQELPDWMTVRGFLDYLRPFYPTWDDAALIRQLDLPLDRKLKQLSRGMRMKAALASVLAFRPSLILMDEPFSGLDPLVRDELIEALLDRIQDAADGSAPSAPPTILISSHDLAEIESFATHIGFLEQGRLLFAEPMATLTARFREVTVTLGPPSAGRSLAPSAIPFPSWLLPEAGPSLFRFIHSHADTEPVSEQIAAVLPRATAIQSEPMTLRAIFLGLAKSGRTTRASTPEAPRSAAPPYTQSLTNKHEAKHEARSRA